LSTDSLTLLLLSSSSSSSSSSPYSEKKNCNLRSTIFWGVMLCSLTEIYRRFGGMYSREESALFAAFFYWLLGFFNSNIGGGGWSPTGSTRHFGHQLAYCTCFGWLRGWRIWWNDDWQGKLKYSEKTCPSVTLSTTNPIWRDRARNRAAAVGTQWLTAIAWLTPRSWSWRQSISPKYR
jgi:hypothetical protein